MMRARLYCLATLLGAGAIVALASTPTAMAIPECTQTGPTTIQCERPGNAQITTSPGVDNNHPPDLGQISAQARSRFAQVIVIVIDGGEEFARWWIELCCAPVELKSRLVEARVNRGAHRVSWRRFQPRLVRKFRQPSGQRCRSTTWAPTGTWNVTQVRRPSAKSTGMWNFEAGMSVDSADLERGQCRCRLAGCGDLHTCVPPSDDAETSLRGLGRAVPDSAPG